MNQLTYNFQAQAKQSQNYKKNINQRNWLQRCEDPIRRRRHHRQDPKDHIAEHHAITEENQEERVVHMKNAHVQSQRSNVMHLKHQT